MAILPGASHLLGKAVPVVNVGYGAYEVVNEESGYKAETFGRVAIRDAVMLLPAWPVSIPAGLYIDREMASMTDARKAADAGTKKIESGEYLRRIETHAGRLETIAATHTEELKKAGLLTINADGKYQYDFRSTEKLEKFKSIIQGKIDADTFVADGSIREGWKGYVVDHPANAASAVGTYFSNIGSWVFDGGRLTFSENERKIGNAKSSVSAQKGNLAVLNEIIEFDKQAKVELASPGSVTREAASKAFSEKPVTEEEAKSYAKPDSGFNIGGFSFGKGTIIGTAIGLVVAFFNLPLGLAIAAGGGGLGYMYDKHQSSATVAQTTPPAPPVPNNPRSEGPDPSPTVAPKLTPPGATRPAEKSK